VEKWFESYGATHSNGDCAKPRKPGGSHAPERQEPCGPISKTAPLKTTRDAAARIVSAANACTTLPGWNSDANPEPVSAGYVGYTAPQVLSDHAELFCPIAERSSATSGSLGEKGGGAKVIGLRWW